MRKQLLKFIGSPILVGLMFTALVYMCKYLVDAVKIDYQTEANKYESRLGDTVVLQKDTLIIVDYSTVRKTFKLSNGAEVSKSLIPKKSK